MTTEPRSVAIGDVMVGPAWRDPHGLLPRSLDTAFELMAARKRLFGQVDGRGLPTRPGTALVGVGIENIRRGLMKVEVSREMHTAHPTCGITEETFHHDRTFQLRGGRLVSMYNPAGTPEALKTLLTSDPYADGIAFAPVPVQMIIFDRRMVAIEGPELDGERTVIAVTDPAVLSAAWRYWDSLRPLAVSVHDAFGHDPLARFSPRQREIVHLLADDHTDQVIAVRLDLSLRTVQYEVAAIMRILNVRSRFGAGMAIGRLGLPR